MPLGWPLSRLTQAQLHRPWRSMKSLRVRNLVSWKPATREGWTALPPVGIEALALNFAGLFAHTRFWEQHAETSAQSVLSVRAGLSVY
jgi:hypothetical protein